MLQVLQLALPNSATSAQKQVRMPCVQSGGVRLNRTLEACTAINSTAPVGTCPASAVLNGTQFDLKKRATTVPTETSDECNSEHAMR